MKNVEISRNGDKVTITFDVTKEFGRSQGGKGKNIVVASTEGNVAHESGVIIGLNVYKRPS